MLSARGFIGRTLVRARFSTNTQLAVQCRITNGHHIDQLRSFQRGALSYRKTVYKEHVMSGMYQIIVRHQSGGPSSERTQILLKHLLRILAAFLLLHFLGIYFRYKYKRKGEAAHRTPPYAIETRLDQELKRRFTIINGYMLPDFINERSYNDIYNFKVHPDDVYVVSFPKSGTTWVQEIVYLIKKDVNVRLAKAIIMEERFPYLEYVYPGVKEISKKLGGRLIKTHLPLSLLPEGVMDRRAKIIYIVRNPKDTSVSYFHYARMLTVFKYKRPFNEFFERYIKGDVPYGPWWNHLMEFWEKSYMENILIITYEELQQDMKKGIRKIAKFLGRNLSDEQVDMIAEHCAFKAMQSNPAANYGWWDSLGLRDKSETKFLRKGKVGDWHNYYSDEQNEKMDQLCRDKLGKHDLHFTYDLRD